MSREPFDSRAEAPPAKRLEKGYGDENEEEAALLYILIIILRLLINSLVSFSVVFERT